MPMLFLLTSSCFGRPHRLHIQLVHWRDALLNGRQLLRGEVHIAVGHLKARRPKFALQADHIAAMNRRENR